jgi:hypothetical protein
MGDETVVETATLEDYVRALVDDEGLALELFRLRGDGYRAQLEDTFVDADTLDAAVAGLWERMNPQIGAVHVAA